MRVCVADNDNIPVVPVIVPPKVVLADTVSVLVVNANVPPLPDMFNVAQAAAAATVTVYVKPESIIAVSPAIG